MKKFLLLGGAWLVLSAPAAMADTGGINFAWGAGCWGENPVNSKTFACNTNTGNAQATGSFAPSANMDLFVGIEGVVDLQADAVSLPSWWQFFNSGSCRSTSLSMSSDFSSAPGTSCADPYAGLAAGGLAAYQTSGTVPPNPHPGDNVARIKLAAALADPSPLVAKTEYYGFRLTINYAKTVGTGACAGCNTGVTLVLNEIKAANNDGTSERISTPLQNICLTWNASTVSCNVVGTQRNRTWGSIKALYHD